MKGKKKVNVNKVNKLEKVYITYSKFGSNRGANSQFKN